MSAYSSSHRIDTPLADQVYGQQPCSIHSIGGGSQLIADEFADIKPDPIYTHY